MERDVIGMFSFFSVVVRHPISLSSFTTRLSPLTMAMPSVESTCPLCSSKIQQFHLSLDCDFVMCENQGCPYPFQTKNFTEYVVDHRTGTGTSNGASASHSAQPAHAKKGRKRKACNPLDSSESHHTPSSTASSKPPKVAKASLGLPVPYTTTQPPITYSRTTTPTQPLHFRPTPPYPNGQSAAVHAHAPPSSTIYASSTLHTQKEYQVVPRQDQTPLAFAGDTDLAALLSSDVTNGDDVVVSCMDQYVLLTKGIDGATDAGAGASVDANGCGELLLEDIEGLLSPPGLSEDGGSSSATSDGGIGGLEDGFSNEAMSFGENLEDFNFLDMGQGVVAL
ncbi:hypothetical protein BC936DRAFT_141283 [Jimgerdemannia flammicorona]|uniref:Uncharacterized protein n=1 Tax=Jimgerdemannia flammicorona TaxID=994334 RepID=A0A433DG64_9FUNG|nr:hypothetical protein BC936DRAFT_141283 [Jimgerdemannia flammicorona]